MQGCHVTDVSISATKEGAVELTGTLTGCRVFNARPSSVGAEAQAFATSIVVEDAKVFFTGQKIQNVTKSDDNSGKGYAVTAVDKRTNTLTVAPGISEALIATAMGLLVAIPATIGYNTFHGSLGVLETRLVNFAGMFLNRVQRELNAHRAVSRSGQAE